METVRQDLTRHCKSIFYLKINKSSDQAVMCFFHWVDICEMLDADFYVVCDDEELKKQLLKIYDSNRHSETFKFISSYRDELSGVCSKIIRDSMRKNIGYALLTPFIHAKKNGFEKIWNIDADDTVMFAHPQICAEILSTAERYAEERQIDCFSFDMWYSQFRFNNILHWSFGIVFVNMAVDYIKTIEAGKDIAEKIEYAPITSWNIDSFFSFLKEQGLLRCETFYCENLWFEHCDFAISKYNEGMLKFITAKPHCSPILKTDYEGVPIAEDVVKFDIGLMESQLPLGMKDEISQYYQCSYNNSLQKIPMEINVSIIVPVHNAGPYLEQCLYSLANQKFHNYEIIIVYDHSEDNSLDICKFYAESYNQIKLIIRETNTNHLCGARNLGAEKALGRYILFAGSGDYADPYLCRKTFDIAEKYGVDFVAFKFDTFHQSVPKTQNRNPIEKKQSYQHHRVLNQKEIIKAYAALRMPEAAFSKLYRKSSFFEHDLFFYHDEVGEDSYQTFSMLDKNLTAYFLNESLYYARQRPVDIFREINCNPKNIKEFCDVFLFKAEKILNMDDEILTIEQKRGYILKSLEMHIVPMYLNYQQKAAESLLFTEQIGSKDNFIFWGASNFGITYTSMFKVTGANIMFCDNDKRKHGKMLMGCQIISPVVLKEIYDKNTHRLLITSMWFFPIVRQLISEGIIDTIDEVMPFRGITARDKVYANIFDYICKNFSNVI